MTQRDYPLEGPEEPEIPPAEDSSVLGASDDEGTGDEGGASSDDVREDENGTPKENPSG